MDEESEAGSEKLGKALGVTQTEQEGKDLTIGLYL